MALRFIDIINDVEDMSLVTSKTSMVKRKINQALQRVYQSHDFPYYMQNAAIETTLLYDTGTIDVTNGSTAVSGTSTVWTSAMAGRKIRVEGQNAFYEIASVTDATNLVLNNNFQGSTATSQNYEIYQDEYRIEADVDKYKMLRQIENAVPIASYSPTDFDELFPAPSSYADPLFEMMIGTKLDTDTTGTVTGSVATSVLTGSGTSWTSLEGFGRLSPLRVGDNVFTVKSVDSDTQVTIYESISSGITAAAYEITLNNIRVQLYQIPDTQRLIYYRYFRLPTPLINDYDLPDMPDGFHYLLVWGALSDMFATKGDIVKAENVFEQRFLNGLAQMKLKVGSFTPDRIYRKKSIDRVRTTRGRLDGLETSSFDRRYSNP